MLHSINNLRTVAELCRAGQPLPEPLAVWLGNSLRSFLEHGKGSLNDAFGLRGGQGGIPWHMEEAIRKRDAALRELRARHFQNLKPSVHVRTIHEMSCRYAASGWRFDCEREAMPDRYRGTPKEHLWLAFKSGAMMPLCVRQLRTILRVEPRNSRRDGAHKQVSFCPVAGERAPI